MKLKGIELLIIDKHAIDINFFVENQKDVLRCIKNYRMIKENNYDYKR